MGGICGRKIKYEIQFEDELYGVDPEYYVIGIVAPREIQKKMMKHIAKRGYNLMFFDNAQELLDQYDQDKIDRTRHVDIIIYHSKTVDSFGDREILQFMQEHPELAHTPLIRIGNNPKKGWDEFVLDPINWNVLSLKISGLLLRIAAVKNKRILRLKQENFLTIINPHRQVDELDLLTQKDYVKPSKCHVLIADPNEDVADAVAAVLIRNEYNVMIAESPDDAIDQLMTLVMNRKASINEKRQADDGFSENVPLPLKTDVLGKLRKLGIKLDCIVVDINSFYSQGHVIEWVKAQDDTKSIPIVLTSHLDELADNPVLPALSFYPYINIVYKPFTSDTIKNTVHELINRTKSRLHNQLLLRQVAEYEKRALSRTLDQDLDDGASIRIRNEMPFF